MPHNHGKRQFAKNSENVRHFRLLSRSGKDPEGDNAEASPLVLEPFVPVRLKGKVDEEEMMTIPESLQALGPEVFGLETCAATGSLPTRNREGSSDEEDDGEEHDDAEELDDDCYFPKDGYNYNQHLKTLSRHKKTGGVGGIVVDAPKKEEPKILDPAGSEIISEIQEPVNFEEQEVMQALMDCDNPGYEDIDDDFFVDELLPGGAIQPEVVMWGPAALEDAGLPDLALFKEMHAQRLAAMAGEGGDEDDDDEGSEGAPEPGEAVSNERFEMLLEDEYNDDETGALDDEEIEGAMTMETMEAMLDEYLEDREEQKQKLESINEPISGKYDNVPRTLEETRAIIARHYVNDDDAESETSAGDSEEDESKNWDCETVLSTLSNLSNRPGKISKIKLVKKPNADKDLAAIAEGGASDAESSDEDAVELPDVVTDRPQNESLEDKKIRKAAVKEMRRICRKMKKESKEMYKSEAAKLNKKQSTGDVRQKLRCLKL